MAESLGKCSRVAQAAGEILSAKLAPEQGGGGVSDGVVEKSDAATNHECQWRVGKDRGESKTLMLHVND